MAGMGLDDEAYRAQAALLRSPARPSTTPFLDMERGMMNPLVPFGPAPLGPRAAPPQVQEYPRRHMFDMGRPPEPAPGSTRTTPEGRINEEQIPWERQLGEGRTGALIDSVSDAAQSSWEGIRESFRRGFSALDGSGIENAVPAPEGLDYDAWGEQGAAAIPAEAAAPMQGPPAPTGEDAPSPTAARDAAVPRDMVIGRDSGSVVASETAPGASPGASSTAPAMPTPPAMTPYDGSVGDAAKMEAQDSALLRAGLAMMASDNPSFMGVLGEGGLAGLEGYEADLDTAREDARYGAEYDMKAQQQAFDNQISQISTQLAFARDAREEKLLTARLARAMAAGRGGRMPNNRYEFYLMGVQADVEALARQTPGGRLPPEVIQSIEQKWQTLTQQMHSRDSGFALDEDTGSALPPIGSSAASLMGGEQ